MDHWPTLTRLVAPPDLCDSGTAPVSLKRRQKLSTNDTEKTKLLRSKHSWQRMPWFLNLMLGNKKERISTLSTSLTEFFRQLAGLWGCSCSSWDFPLGNQSRNWVDFNFSGSHALNVSLRSFPTGFVFFLVVASQFPNSAASGTWKQMPTCNLYISMSGSTA